MKEGKNNKKWFHSGENIKCIGIAVKVTTYHYHE